MPPPATDGSVSCPPAKRQQRNAHVQQDAAALPHRTCHRPNDAWLRSKGVSPKHTLLVRRNAGGTHEPFDAHDYTTNPLAAKFPLQTDLNQLEGSEKCTFPAAFGPCTERPAGVAALVTSGAFPILTRRRESSASGSRSDKKETTKSRVCHPLDFFFEALFTD